MAGWIGRINTIKGAFLKGNLEDNKQKNMKVPRGFKKYYPNDMMLLLLKATYGTKQAVMVFWRELLACMKDTGYKRSGIDPRMHYKWTIVGLIIWISWIDDCMVWRPKEIMKEDSDKSNKYFDCDDVGEVKEYVG
eukprot:13985989-Ditylum_brightwellii.AAC.1